MPSARIFSALCIKRTKNITDFCAVVNHHRDMQDRTIDNALLALRKQGGHQGKLAEVLLDMRGVPTPRYLEVKAFRRGGTKKIILEALQDGPKTTGHLGDAIRQHRPDLTPKAAANRAYQSIVRLVDQGRVLKESRPDGCLWRLAQLGQP